MRRGGIPSLYHRAITSISTSRSLELYALNRIGLWRSPVILPPATRHTTEPMKRSPVVPGITIVVLNSAVRLPVVTSSSVRHCLASGATVREVRGSSRDEQQARHDPPCLHRVDNSSVGVVSTTLSCGHYFSDGFNRFQPSGAAWRSSSVVPRFVVLDDRAIPIFL